MSSEGAGAMSEENDEMSALVPRLRFPEFQGDPWEAKPLEQVAPLQRGFDLPSSELQPGDIPVVYSNGVQSFHCTAMAKAPGLVTGRSGTIGKLNFIEKGEYWPHNTSLWVTSFKGNVPKFVYFLFNSIGMERFASGSGVPTLNRNDVHAFVSAVPKSLAEQEQIADCLSSLDELITAESQKLDALKTHKKGLMRQLFPREGETVPRLRFPEFREAGEWEQTALGLITRFQSGGTPSKANPAYWNGSIPWVSAKDMKTLFLDDTEDHITTTSVENGAKLVGPGSLLILTRGMTLLKDIPICVLNRRMSFNQDVKALLVKGDTDGRFLAYLLLGNKERLLGLVDIAGHGTGRLDTDELKSFELTLPQRSEQQRIADCLSSLDDLITAQSQKIDALKIHKKGLMQQLFPVLDEVPA
jgi:type I restriction enzyme S subunit